MPYYLLEPTTEAAQSKEIVCNHKAIPVYIASPGLSGSEVVTVKRRAADDSYYNYSELTATSPGVVLNAPGIYMGSKPVTVNPVGVEVSTDARP